MSAPTRVAVVSCSKNSCGWCWHRPWRALAGMLFQYVPLGRLAPHVFGIAICADRWERVE